MDGFRIRGTPGGGVEAPDLVQRPWMPPGVAQGGLQVLDRLLHTSGHEVADAAKPAEVKALRVGLQRVAGQRDRLVQLARGEQVGDETVTRIDGQRIELHGAPQQRRALVHPVADGVAQQRVTVVVIGLNEVGVELDGELELALGGGPVPVVLHVDAAQRAVRLGELVVELQSALRGRLGLGQRFTRRQRGHEAECAVDLGDPGMRRREVGIEPDRRIELVQRLEQGHAVAAAHVLPPLEVVLVGGDVVGR